MKILMAFLIFWSTTSLYATTCESYEEVYDMALYRMQEEGKVSYRNSYDLINAIIDSGLEYVAYCQDKLTLSQQYQIQQVLKRADKKRRAYFIGAVHEYHAILGIRPNVRDIYLDGGFYSGVRGGSRSTTPRMPPIQQPMPPIRH